MLKHLLALILGIAFFNAAGAQSLTDTAFSKSKTDTSFHLKTLPDPDTVNSAIQMISADTTTRYQTNKKTVLKHPKAAAGASH